MWAHQHSDLCWSWPFTTTAVTYLVALHSVLSPVLCCVCLLCVLACVFPLPVGPSSRCFSFGISSQSCPPCIAANVTTWIQRASTVNKDDIYWTALVLHQHFAALLVFLSTACSGCVTCYSGPFVCFATTIVVLAILDLYQVVFYEC